MIVCDFCGAGLSEASSSCSRCSGKAVERITPVKSLLNPTQRKGSPDRWADRYTSPTTSPRSSTSFTLMGKSGPHLPSSPLRTSTKDTFDVCVTNSAHAELARVYGSVLDSRVQHPRCARCLSDIKSGMKIYLAPRHLPPIVLDDTLCKACYTECYALGECVCCSRPIIGDRDEGLGGRHICARGRLWHANCFRCSVCGALPSVRDVPILLPSGTPVCQVCHEQLESLPTMDTTQSLKVAGVQPRKYLRPGEVLADSRRTNVTSSDTSNTAVSQNPWPRDRPSTIGCRAAIPSQPQVSSTDAIASPFIPESRLRAIRQFSRSPVRTFDSGSVFQRPKPVSNAMLELIRRFDDTQQL